MHQPLFQEIGYSLRNLVKQSGIKVGEGQKKRRVSLGGRNRLTDKVIDRLQYYFGVAVRRKVNTSEKEMRDNILSSLFHCSSSDENPTHQLCPKTKDSWCFYQRAIVNGKTPDSHSTMIVRFQLPPEELEIVKNVYDRLTTDSNMLKCLRGKTQNPNESLHSRIWIHCPKHLTPSKMRFDFAAAVAVSHYNVGYENSNLHKRLGLPYTEILAKHLRSLDHLFAC